MSLQFLQDTFDGKCTGQGRHTERSLLRDEFNLVIHIVAFKSSTTLHVLSLDMWQQNGTSFSVGTSTSVSSTVARNILLLINGKYIICGLYMTKSNIVMTLLNRL